MTAAEPLGDREWMRRFQQRSIRSRVPLTCLFEVTSSCNLKCVHCYLGPQEEQRRKRKLEMSTDRVKEILDEIAAMGCLYLVLTGGDPMVRKDFPEIYRHARGLGLLVTVFCDGILVNERILELFRDFPPLKVDISVYGATAETYETVTRVPGSFPKFLRGLERLRAHGIRFGLKTVLMSINRHELGAMRAMAEDLGVPFRMDSALFPCLPTNDHEPLDLRVEPREVVDLELSDPTHLQNWVDYVEERSDLPEAESLYTCGAGTTSFYIDPLGYASPCLMTTHHRHSLAERSFSSLWKRELVQLRSKKPREGYTCNSCEMRVACSSCPAFNYQENGEEDVKSEYVCETTRHRWETIQNAREGSVEAESRRVARRRAVASREGEAPTRGPLLPILR